MWTSQVLIERHCLHADTARSSQLQSQAAEPDTWPTCMSGVTPVPAAETSSGARQNGAFVQFEACDTPKQAADAEQMLQDGLKGVQQGIHLPMNTRAPPQQCHTEPQAPVERPEANWKV